ncbi:two-component system CitB family sensor kinase [Microbacterium terrae]|uniref:Sensor-like histidine kinase SenX3 n=1 Tax=Microbacterium terrae TaxID=69369 RepID=A0A0M2H5K9_9MICO|nr:ATP-binding protein [Microbacterium terrae]KJL39254.1 Sensor histidine kinase DcuS [Microbacterium terrae]MBP1076812.1 two-component system CitB family sensor kinase [Microbacterium terrae]GLJ99406.1 histidine kinase [Microbacterium terrae]
MRFATRLLLVQLVTVVAVVAVCTAVFGWLAVRQLRAESEASALNIARTVAEDPDVQALVAEYSADPGTPDAAGLSVGPLQELAADVAARTDALFVVITDDHGIRLAHPNAEILGQVVSTPFEEVLAGNEVVDWEVGTLGESARAKVPVFPADGGAPVGEVSVGFERASVFDDLPAVIASIAIVAGGAVALAALATLLLRRRFERLTLGVQPEELVALVQNQAAVLDGVGDGVIALDPDGTVRVCNDAAERMLGIDAPLGRAFDGLGLGGAVVADIRSGRATDGVVVGDRVLYIDARPVTRNATALGEVIVIRDRTDVEALATRLDSVRAMTEALRVQRHEFANRLHVAAGLLDAERVPDARAFLGDLLARGSVDFAVVGIERVTDPFLQSLLGAKALTARERGVALRISDDTLLLGTLEAVEDVAAIVGNLVDNALTAAVDAAVASDGAGAAWIEVALLGDADELVVTVSDSGNGVPAGTDPFARAGGAARSDAGGRAEVAGGADAGADVDRVERVPDDAVHGRGFGLPLSRDLARRVGGEVWLIDGGGDGRGAVFGARIPAALRLSDTAPRDRDGTPDHPGPAAPHDTETATARSEEEP